RIFYPPSGCIGICKTLDDAHSLVIAKAYDVIIFAEAIPLGSHEIDHRLNLQKLSAPAFSPVRKPLLSINEGLKWLSAARSGFVSDFSKSRRRFASFEPMNINAPAISAFVNEIERFGSLLARVGKDDMGVSGKLSIMRLKQQIEHIA